MALRLLAYLWRRLRPAGGWLPFFLLLAAVNCLAAAVVAVEWTPEVQVVTFTANGGLLLGALLASRRRKTKDQGPRTKGRRGSWVVGRGSLHWFLLLSYGLVATVAWLGRLVPLPSLWFDGWQPSAEHIRHQWTILATRANGWLQAVAAGEASTETIVFAFGLGLLAWLLAAYAAWSVFRQRRPLAGLTLVGLALAVNGYYGNAPLWPVPLFIGLATFLIAAVHFTDIEQEWEAQGVDYSGEIRLELLLISGGVALSLLATAFILPGFRPLKLARAVLASPAVVQTEETLARVFAGVQQPRREMAEAEPPRGPAAAAPLPRSFLVGNPPELYQTVVLRASVEIVEIRDWRLEIDDQSPIPNLQSPSHWRGATYDQYTGRGWSLSPDAQASVPPATLLDSAVGHVSNVTPQPLAFITQSVALAGENEIIRYTLGRPTRFDQPTIAYWHAAGDLAWVAGAAGASYTAVSAFPLATPEELRRARLEDVPADVLARYTILPEDVPPRVHALARAIAAGEITPYDQTVALESFLRQYPYTLAVEFPPAGVDTVDFFLFQLQRGYCDYYASAMVVLARSLGLPARLATGYLAQPADATGVQTITQANAHAWAEVYFAGYGWIEFEPTAAFAGGQAADSRQPTADSAVELPLPLPPAVAAYPFWIVLLLLLPLTFLGWWLWQRQRQPRPAALDGVQWAYSRLQHAAHRLGLPTPPGQTPAEFTAALLERLEIGDWRLGRARWQGDTLFLQVRRLAALFMARQYGREKLAAPAEVEAISIWKKLRGRLWWLRFRR